MKIAFTGASSTGKTTAATQLMAMPAFRSHVDVFHQSGGRELLDGLGFDGLDAMDSHETAFYELAYFIRKLDREQQSPSFLSDRSYLDVAAFWLERDTIGRSEYVQQLLVEPCRRLTREYDLHFYFPTGLIPFVEDGRRSSEQRFHQRIDNRIRSLAEDWRVPLVTVEDSDLDRRVDFISATVVATTRFRSATAPPHHVHYEQERHA
ncbi:ATP-binding protein [Kribbella sp. NPDC003557]|uniref:ATP/GTP-binding protein n=1 Tax=Kribbella sp. NPDC003557 TaxID=3154449 RepID=UPI0033A70689